MIWSTSHGILCFYVTLTQNNNNLSWNDFYSQFYHTSNLKVATELFFRVDIFYSVCIFNFTMLWRCKATYWKSEMHDKKGRHERKSHEDEAAYSFTCFRVFLSQLSASCTAAHQSTQATMVCDRAGQNHRGRQTVVDTQLTSSSLPSCSSRRGLPPCRPPSCSTAHPLGT